jgi:hypothetical protein
MKKLLIIVLGSFLIFACVYFVVRFFGAPDHTKTYTLKDIDFVYEGPLFQGSNSAQYVAKIDLKEILAGDYKEGMNIDNAVLKNATAQCVDPVNFQDINALVFSVASDKSDLPMRELAVVNPLISTLKSIKLKPSKEVDISDFFAEKQVYLILDASFLRDVNAKVNLKGTFEFELKY